MEKVTASDAIVEIAGSQDTSGKLNMWANIIKWIIIVLSIIVILVGFGMIIFGENKDRGIGLLLVVIGVIEAFIAYFYVYCLRAFAIITEAASIFVLEHKDKSDK